jgi:hypothetical protein
MSYSVFTPCYNCKENVVNGGECKDAIHLQEGVNAMYQDTGHHKGSGTILLSCTKLVQNQPCCQSQ